MKEYIERGALLKDIGETVLFSVRGGAETPTAEMRGARKVISRIKDAPTADVVEVVRCKDCVHEHLIACPLYFIEHTFKPVNHDAEFFCGKGERRKENAVD